MTLSTTGGSLLSANWSDFPPILEMPGCSITDQLPHPSLLARDGDPESIQLEEIDNSFAIGWKGYYRIEGSAFIYTDRDSRRIRTMLGYPTQKIARAG
jgi:hypothetical protein